MRGLSGKEITMEMQPEGFKCARNDFVPRRHPVRDAWHKVLDVLVRVLSFGTARVVVIEKEVCFRNWRGIIRSNR